MRRLVLLLVILSYAHTARAQVLGTVRVTLHDAQDLALPGATLVLKAEASDAAQKTLAPIRSRRQLPSPVQAAPLLRPS